MRLHAVALALVLALIPAARADVYLHTGGSNNRLNENTATRNNNNRLFDSQNNARGGLNVGDKTNNAFNGNTPLNTNFAQLYSRADNTASQYPMVFYEGSELTHQWTSQHSCGGNDGTDPYNINCNLVLQYTCDTETKSEGQKDQEVYLHNGGNTGTPDATGNYNDAAGQKTNNDNNQRGRHENEYAYALCQTRERNKGLFTADRNLQGDSAIYTRQNNNGGRSGLECPEERDYYPYWTPTPWRDIAYLTTAIGDQNVDICKLVQGESQNVAKRYRCGPVTDATKAKHNNKAACEAASGTWEEFAAHGIPAPDCKQSAWSRDNHLGDGRDGTPNNYTWTLPSFSQLTTTQKFKTYGTDNDMVKCVVRIRYNMTSDDYDGWNINADSNQAKSPVKNNPTVDIAADLQGLQLALNTAQVGRTFQDRTHMFFIKKRPAALAGKRIVNLMTRGKRGNIVQTFPSVEYDFVPNDLTVTTNDFVHIQWTGSNTHNNNGDGGDGQSGDDGQGQGGTDRNNFVLSKGDEGLNWPLPLDKTEDHMFKHAKCFNSDATVSRIGSDSDWLSCSLVLATSGYYSSAAEAGTKDALNNQMNNAPASLAGGVLLQVSKPGFYPYMCSRNNNFSNRSQKGKLTVRAPMP
jgi:plastocyanin